MFYKLINQLESNMETNRTKFSIWMQALRPFSYTASVIPVLLGAMITLVFYEGEINWPLMIVIALGSPLFQVAGNLLSEYYDFIHKVDRAETYGSSRVLIEGLLQPKQVFKAGIGALVVLFATGMILVYFRGIPMLVIGMIGILASLFYTVFKYRALGDFHIYLTFGPLMVFGTTYALIGNYELLITSLILSIPIGFLVTAILHANNTRDIMHDTQAGIKTLASTLGLKGAQNEYYFLIFGSFISVVIFIILGLVSPWSLIVFLSIMPALKNVKAMGTAEVKNPAKIEMLDVMTAQHHLLFGVLFSISILIMEFIK
jgi:1,4-dihydroxy-2-naphthoate octaprenyltransferase